MPKKFKKKNNVKLMMLKNSLKTNKKKRRIFCPKVSQIGANVISINLFGCTRNTAERKWILFPKKLKERHPKKLKNMQQFFGTGKKNSRYVCSVLHRSSEISKKSRKKTLNVNFFNGKFQQQKKNVVKMFIFVLFHEFDGQGFF